MSDSEIWLLGVDGGGSKTEAWLTSRDDHLQGLPAVVGLAGPSNPRTVGMEEATREILMAIESARSQIEAQAVNIQAACLAIAGADRVDTKQQLVSWAREQNLACHIMVCNDAEPILARTPQRIGVALIAGTGSFAYGRNERGEVHRAGGWGYRFGDEGSGYSIAVAGIAAALRYADGRSASYATTTSLSRPLWFRVTARIVAASLLAEYGTRVDSASFPHRARFGTHRRCDRY